jgi:beta-glucosidase-like glycosyl hydrolase
LEFRQAVSLYQDVHTARIALPMLISVTAVHGSALRLTRPSSAAPPNPRAASLAAIALGWVRTANGDVVRVFFISR